MAVPASPDGEESSERTYKKIKPMNGLGSEYHGTEAV